MHRLPVSKHFVLGEESCPNCNASAVLVGNSVSHRTDTLAVSIVCHKCKHNTVTGFTTARAVGLKRRKERLICALDDTMDEDAADELLRRIGEIERIERRMQLGL